MNIQIEINGEVYSGTAYQAADGLVIHLPGIQADSAPPFETLFQSLPVEKPDSGFLEVGEWNGKKFPFETQVSLVIGPDGMVWAQVCDTPSKLPDTNLQVATDLDIEPDEGPLVEQYENSTRLHDDDWMEAAYEDRISGLGDDF